jgi:tRNA pseudouridine55 synthase
MSTHYDKAVNGWIILDKPQGVGSNQVLRKIQYLLRAKKAGHIGTLDPFASGVLPMAFGEATKLIPYLENAGKTYEFTLRFGEATTTDDTEGEVCATSEVLPSREELEAVLERFRGDIMQIPPKFSAIHVNGQRAYKLARQQGDFSMPERAVHISELKLLTYYEAEKSADFSVSCSKGTYVRTLGKDIAEAVGSCGHLTRLRRTKNGIFSLDDTILLENLKNVVYKGCEDSIILPVETFLCDITVIALTEGESLKLKSGQAIESRENISFEKVAAACFENKLIALVEYKDGMLYPTRVFNL